MGVLHQETDPKLVVEDESGDWRLYELNDSGHRPLYRAYHKHDEGWVSQLILMAVCARCRAEAPKAMKGFENLVRWENQ
jgi:hypothetical protein